LLSIWLSSICEDAPKKKLSHIGVWGAIQDIIKQAQSRKALHIEMLKIFIV
jgi:hypothetical protein